MFVKKATPAQLDAAKNRLSEAFGKAEAVNNVPVKEYMLKWLSAFAPDMTFYDAKSFCLPRLMYKNYLWHAFSFQKTDCYMDEDADAAFGEGFDGECYILLNDENLLCKTDGSALTLEKIKTFENIIVFTIDYTKTYVYTGKEGFGPYFKSADMATEEDAEPIEPIEPAEGNE